MRGLLLYNPLAGRNRQARAAVIQQVFTVLQHHGFDLQVAATVHRGSAGQQAREATEAGAEVIFACGGDGTVHDVLQGVAGTSAALAILPLGSANALARELKLPSHPLEAAQAYACHIPIEVQLGNITTGGQLRHFLLITGAGADGALMHRMLNVNRSRWGRWAYAAHALHLLVGHRFANFTVHYQLSNGETLTTQAIAALGMRTSRLGGIFPGIARKASLNAPYMRLALIHAPAIVGLPLWFATNWLGLEHLNPLLTTANVTRFTCSGNTAVHTQADGEYLGTLPALAQLTEETVRILVPASAPIH